MDAAVFAAETPIFAAMLAAWDGPAALIVASTAQGRREAEPERPAWPQVRHLLSVEPAPGKAVSSEAASNESVVITAAGQLNVLTAGLLDAPLRQALRARPRQVTLDLLGIEALSGAGLQALLELRRAAAAQGVELTLRAPSPAVLASLDATGTAAVFGDAVLDRPAR